MTGSAIYRHGELESSGWKNSSINYIREKGKDKVWKSVFESLWWKRNYENVSITSHPLEMYRFPYLVCQTNVLQELLGLWNQICGFAFQSECTKGWKRDVTWSQKSFFIHAWSNSFVLFFYIFLCLKDKNGEIKCLFPSPPWMSELATGQYDWHPLCNVW